MVDTVLFVGVTRLIEQLSTAFVVHTLRVRTSSGSTEIDDEAMTREPPSQNLLPLTLCHLLALLLRMIMMMIMMLLIPLAHRFLAKAVVQHRLAHLVNTGKRPNCCLRLRLKKCKKKHKGIVLKMKKRL